MKKNIILLFILVALHFVIFSKTKGSLIDIDQIHLEYQLPKTDKSFTIKTKFGRTPKNIKKSDIEYLLGKYLNDSLSQANSTTNAETYRFNIYFDRFDFYENERNDNKKHCSAVGIAKVKITKNKKVISKVKFKVMAREYRLIDKNVGNLEEIKVEMLNDMINQFFQKINEMPNFQSFLKDDKYHKYESSDYNKEKKEIEREVFVSNKEEYRMFSAFSLFGKIGYAYNVNSNMHSMIIGYLLGPKFYPHDKISISYQFDVGQLFWSHLLNLAYGVDVLNLTNRLTFEINLIEKSHFQLSLSFPVEYSSYLTIGKNMTYTDTKTNDSIFYPGWKVLLNHIIEPGIGINFYTSSSYIYRKASSWGLEISYFGLYTEILNQWYHGIGISLTYQSQYGFFLYRDKPRKFVKRNNFRRF
ncbi:MAG: hypothetical protein MJB14_19685 [Spirochaetes bacterium]|nr:hypothetical protein [Spirochaetota bacterium]